MPPLWRLLLSLVVLLVVQVACQDEAQQPEQPVEAAQADGPATGEAGEEAPPAQKEMTEEEKKQAEQLRDLYIKYVRNHASLPCLERLQALFSAPEEERPAKNDDFQAACGEEMKQRA